MHFIRHCIINADAYDIKIERCRWKSRRVTYRCSVPFPPPPPPSLLLSFSRGASKQEREANTPILINSRGISIYSSQKKHERCGHCLSPLALFFNRPTLYLPPFSVPDATSRLGTPRLLKAPSSNCLASFRFVASPPFFLHSSHDVFQRYVWTVLPFRFSLASTKSVCLDATSEKLEDRNCSDVTEFLFFFSKLMILSYREIFLVLSKRSWGLWSWIIISRRNGDFFSRKKLGKSLRFVLTRDRVSPGEYFLQENSISTIRCRISEENCPPQLRNV